jgi:hypothetical protein
VIVDFAMGDGKRLYVVRFEVFSPVTMKNIVFWDVTPCASVRTDVSEDSSN